MRYIFIVCLGILVFCSISFLKPSPDGLGDSPSYVLALSVMNTGIKPIGFVPNRILTTFGALETVRFIGFILKDTMLAWLFMNIVFYFVMCLIFYHIIKRVTKSESTAFISGLFLASNYSALSFGINYLMDIGGWTFYVVSIFFLLKYLDLSGKKYLFYSAALVGVGGLFKEYAYLACVPIATIIIYQHFKNPLVLIKNALATASIAVLPTMLLYIYVFKIYGYSYLDWLGFNREYYVYASRVTEYIKSLGSLYNLLALFVFSGICTLIFSYKNLESKYRLYIAAIFFSILPILCWPAITQRILFITVPFGILLASFFIKKYEKYWYVFIPFISAYAVFSFMMPEILDAVNLPF